MKQWVTELAVGDIWRHQFGEACVFYSTNRDPEANVEHFGTLAEAWRATRHKYGTEDEWALGWDAYFQGQESLAKRLWRRFLRRQSQELAVA